ncbi:hypothetical protein pb186bvf_002773 [Paramecium bursaria]
MRFLIRFLISENLTHIKILIKFLFFQSHALSGNPIIDFKDPYCQIS